MLIEAFRRRNVADYELGSETTAEEAERVIEEVEEFVVSTRERLEEDGAAA